MSDGLTIEKLKAAIKLMEEAKPVDDGPRMAIMYFSQVARIEGRAFAEQCWSALGATPDEPLMFTTEGKVQRINYPAPE